MKGIESVMRGYAEGGNVNPFQAYANTASYSPFSYLGLLSQLAPRPPVRIRTPGSTPGTANPLAPAAGGYQDIYGNLDAIKAKQALKRAAAPASTTVPEAPSTPTGEGGGSTGFSSTPQGTPGSGFNVPGNVLGVAGLLAGIPGAGALGSALGTQAANDYLASLGLPQNVSTLEALKSGLSFGLFGQTPQSQVDKSVEEAVKRGDLTITDLHNILDSLKGPTVAEQYGAQVASGERSASGAFFDAINDLNTVGRLSEVFGAIDRAEADRQAAADRQAEANRAADVLSAIDFQAGLDAAATTTAPSPTGLGLPGFGPENPVALGGALASEVATTTPANEMTTAPEVAPAVNAGLAAAIETLAAEQALGGETNTFGGPGGRATDAAPTIGGVSDVDISAAAANMPSAIDVTTAPEVAPAVNAGLAAAISTPSVEVPTEAPAITAMPSFPAEMFGQTNLGPPIGVDYGVEYGPAVPGSPTSTQSPAELGLPGFGLDNPAAPATSVEVSEVAPAADIDSETTSGTNGEIDSGNDSASGEGGDGDGGGGDGGLAEGGSVRLFDISHLLDYLRQRQFGAGGYVPGGSGGMDDDVPAIIDGKGPARLSSGEFVFDAATVAALGDGNNQAGARKLDGLRKAIRKKAYGHKRQPPKNYSVGDLVRLYDRRR